MVQEVETPTLKGLNFDLSYNGLILIAGKIGTGKTTLLFSIMSETRKMYGQMTIKGKIAYVE
jgi:ABC-type branched-subunit amino acid transport system ATPase component